MIHWHVKYFIHTGHNRDITGHPPLLNSTTESIRVKVIERTQWRDRMTRPRSELIAPETTPYYHVISRCVRRAFLCGEDRYTGQNFDHRKAWIIERIHYLERVFAIDIAAYAVMSNHYHLVLHINVQEAQDLSDQQVIQRWHHLYKGNLLTHRYLKNDSMTEAEIAKAQELITAWRERLSSISWFMRNLNEYVAREANKEDNCKGRLSSRPREFHPQPLPEPYVTVMNREPSR